MRPYALHQFRYEEPSFHCNAQLSITLLATKEGRRRENEAGDTHPRRSRFRVHSPSASLITEVGHLTGVSGQLAPKVLTETPLSPGALDQAV